MNFPRISSSTAPAIVEDVWTHHLARIGAWVVFLLCGFLAVRHLGAATPDLPRALANGLISATGVIALIFLHLHSQRNAVRVLILGGWLAVTVLVGVSGGLYSNNVIVYPLLILLSGHFLGSRTSLLITLASVIAAGGLALMHLTGMIAPVVQKPLINPLASFLAVVSMSGLGTWFFNRSLEDHIRGQRAEAGARVLAEQIPNPPKQQLIEVTENTPGVVFQIAIRPDGNKQFLFVSPRSTELLGIHPADPIFLDRFFARIHASDLPLIQQGIHEAARSATQWNFEVRFSRSDSDPEPSRSIWLKGSSSPTRHGDDLVFSGIMTDITSQKAADQTLLESNQRFEALNARLEARVNERTSQLTEEIVERKKVEMVLRDTAHRLQQIIDTIESGLLVWSADQTLVLWNDAFSRLFPRSLPALRVGQSREEIGKKMRMAGELPPSTDPAGQWESLGRYEVALPDGRVMEINRMATPGGGRLVMHNDITEIRRQREIITRQERMAALGGLVAGVAHEINTPLGNALTIASTLSDHIATLEKALGAGPLKKSAFDRFVTDVKESADQLQRNLFRSAELIQHFKQTAVDQTSDRRREFDLASVLRNIQATVATKIRKAGHCFEIDCPEGVIMDGYPGALGQIVTNLVENSLLHAFDRGVQGHLKLVVSAEHMDRVRIQFTDDGKGIPPENIARVFDPFFTTRLGQGGSGLGLSILLKLCQQVLGGEVQVVSPPGQGATFTLDLPKVAPALATTASH